MSSMKWWRLVMIREGICHSWHYSFFRASRTCVSHVRYEMMDARKGSWVILSSLHVARESFFQSLVSDFIPERLIGSWVILSSLQVREWFFRASTWLVSHSFISDITHTHTWHDLWKRDSFEHNGASLCNGSWVVSHEPLWRESWGGSHEPLWRESRTIMEARNGTRVILSTEKYGG